MNRLPMHNALKTLAWLEGTWRTDVTAEGTYPTIKPFSYREEIKFTSIGQPMFNYESQSWHPEKKNPMHREVGFLKINPNASDKVALILSHNFGVATIEEGCASDGEIILESTGISRLSEGCKEPGVTKLNRVFRLVDDRLEQIVHMATTNNPTPVQHLRATYVKQPLEN